MPNTSKHIPIMPTITEIIKDQHLPKYPAFTKARAATPSGKVLAEAGAPVQWTKGGKDHQGYIVAIDPSPTRSADGPMILVVNKATGKYDQVRLFKLTPRRAPKAPVVTPVVTSSAAQVATTDGAENEKFDTPAPPLLSPPSSEATIGTNPTPPENIGNGCTPGEIFCAQTVIETPAEQIKGHFAVMEASSLITSHVPGTFREDPRYPKGCQQRDYTLDATEQHKVSRIASKLRPTFLINHTPTAVDGAPIVNKEGIVLGGNGRLMGLKLAYSTGMAENYRDYLMRVADTFGTSKAVIEQFREPVLVRVVDVNMNACAQYSNILNTGMTQKIGFTDFIVSMSRQLKDNDLAEFGTIIDDADVSTVSQITNKPASVRAIRDIFSRRNIITQQNMSEFFDPSSPEDFSELGDLLVSRIVLAAILPDKSLIEAATSYTEKVFKVLPTIIKIKALPPKYTFIHDLQEVIRSERKRRRSGLPKQFYLTQGDMFSGGTPQDDLTPEQLTMWDALDSTLGEWKAFVKKYLDSIPKTEITAHRDSMDTLF